jgi:hypothetical protein
MAADADDVHSLDSQLIRTYSSDHKGRKAMFKVVQKGLE